MNKVDTWKHRWFGVWAESGAAYQNCPSAKEFVVPEVNHFYSKDRLRNYLSSAPIIVSTSRRNFPNPFTGELIGGSISFRTDGKWLWLDDLPDYIEKHGVAIPTVWLAEIEARDYKPPEKVDDELIERLEWPPTA
jgi:hypothetical protein